MQQTDIVPLYQKLVYDQVELANNETAIADLEIPPEAVLNLFTFVQGVEDIEVDQFHGESCFTHEFQSIWTRCRSIQF